MLDELKFVQGAVSKKDFIPAMSHFQIYDNCIVSFNGSITISSPIECDLQCSPNADQLVKAISKCGKNTVLAITPSGKLSVKSGGFRALIECFPERLPTPQPSGTFVKVEGEHLYTILNKLYPIIGEDATRPWANGLLLRGNYAYATNNVILARMALQTAQNEAINIPKLAIKELLRIAQPCTYIQADANTITFHYEKNRWLRTSVLDLKWPDVETMLEGDYSGCTQLPKNFFKQLETLKDFTDDYGRVYVYKDTLSTRNLMQVPCEEKGCDVQVEGLIGGGVYQYDMLSRLKNAATFVQFVEGGKSRFVGDDVQGVLMGLRI